MNQKYQKKRRKKKNHFELKIFFEYNPNEMKVINPPKLPSKAIIKRNQIYSALV